MPTRSAPKIIALLAAVLLSNSAFATSITHLSERDWLAAGEGLLTFDSTTHLEWLDLTLTDGNSILDTEAESFHVDNGGDFRWATQAEITTLLLHTGVPLNLGVTGDSTIVSDTSAFISLLGPAVARDADGLSI